MKLQTKLLLGFSVIAGITVIAAGLGYWQTRKLADALYEVGVVRLPASAALQQLFEAKTALDASKRELTRTTFMDGLANELRSPEAAVNAANSAPATGPVSFGAILDEELRREERAWDRAERAWASYDALPKTPLEEQKWREFGVVWRQWQQSYGRVMDLLAAARRERDVARLRAADEENQQHLFVPAREAREQLLDLLALNDRIVTSVKDASVASRHDAEITRQLMLGAVVLSIVAAVVGGLLLARTIGQSLQPIARAFARIAGGDLETRVPVRAQDEIGAMASAMNDMVASLKASEAARLRAAQNLAEAADRLELALETSRFGVWRRNLRTGAAEWDARMFELFGVPPGAPVPDRAALLTLVVPEDRDAIRAALTVAPEPGHVFRQRVRIATADGSIRHLEIHGRLQVQTGEPAEWTIGVAGDITDIVEAVAESARLRERLQLARNMESLGAQAARVAHDFNNLLTGISGFIELATVSLPAQHEATELLREARAGARSARDLVQRLLRQARNSDAARREPVDLGVATRNALHLLGPSLPPSLSLHVEAAPELPLIAADPGSIERVILNLATNAIHAIGDRPGAVEFAIGPRELAGGLAGSPGCGPGRYVRVAVRDTGCGMDEQVLAKIFEPHFTTKSAEEGSGLGLAIVSDIIAEHRGGLTVSSTPGAGTTFEIYLPVAPLPRQDDAA